MRYFFLISSIFLISVSTIYPSAKSSKISKLKQKVRRPSFLKRKKSTDRPKSRAIDLEPESYKVLKHINLDDNTKNELEKIKSKIVDEINEIEGDESKKNLLINKQTMIEKIGSDKSDFEVSVKGYVNSIDDPEVARIEKERLEDYFPKIKNNDELLARKDLIEGYLANKILDLSQPVAKDELFVGAEMDESLKQQKISRQARKKHKFFRKKKSSEKKVKRKQSLKEKLESLKQARENMKSSYMSALKEHTKKVNAESRKKVSRKKAVESMKRRTENLFSRQRNLEKIDKEISKIEKKLKQSVGSDVVSSGESGKTEGMSKKKKISAASILSGLGAGSMFVGAAGLAGSAGGLAVDVAGATTLANTIASSHEKGQGTESSVLTEELSGERDLEDTERPDLDYMVEELSEDVYDYDNVFDFGKDDDESLDKEYYDQDKDILASVDDTTNLRDASDENISSDDKERGNQEEGVADNYTENIDEEYGPNF